MKFLNDRILLKLFILRRIRRSPIYVVAIHSLRLGNRLAMEVAEAVGSHILSRLSENPWIERKRALLLRGLG